MGCAQLSPEEKDFKRVQIDKMADATIETLTKENDTIKLSFDSAKGYAVVDWKVTKVPVFGAGVGNGVIFNKKQVNANIQKFAVLILVVAGE